MAEAKTSKTPTHVAVHHIVTNNSEGKRVDLAPGTKFTPRDKAEAKHLENAGAAVLNVEVEEVAQPDVDLSQVAK